MRTFLTSAKKSGALKKAMFKRILLILYNLPQSKQHSKQSLENPRLLPTFFQNNSSVAVGGRR